MTSPKNAAENGAKFTINGLATLLAIDRRGIRKKLAAGGLMASGQTSWSLQEAGPVLFAESAEPIEHAQHRDELVQQRIERIKISNEIALKNWAPISLMEKLMAGVLLALREKIWQSGLPETLRREILKDLQNIDSDELAAAACRETEQEQSKKLSGFSAAIPPGSKPETDYD